jgi:pyruvate dehydrogenase E2 component (dihydrolipoamide acetyltransferase)
MSAVFQRDRRRLAGSVLYNVELPRLGDTTQEVLVREWLCPVGTHVEAGSPLVAVETDKVDVQVPSPVSGIVVEHLVEPEQEVAVGAPICVVETPGSRG